MLETARGNVGKELYGKLEQLIEQMSRILKSTVVNPVLFVPLIRAHLAHLGGDHDFCPTIATVGAGGLHDGAIFHCPTACKCEPCIGKKSDKDAAEAAPGPKKMRDIQVYEEVRLFPDCCPLRNIHQPP